MKSEKFTASQRQESMNDTDKKKSKIIAIMYSCPLSASLYLK